MTGLNILALVLSAILSWHYLKGGSMAGCGGGSPCEQVLNSRWSIIAGIFPVSGLAVGVYLALLVASLFIGPATEAPIRRLAWRVMLVLAGSVAGSAIWFTILQKWVIGDFCPYCMTTHITGLLLAVLVIWRAIKRISTQAIPNIRSPFAAMGHGSDRSGPGRHPGSLSGRLYSLSRLSATVSHRITCLLSITTLYQWSGLRMPLTLSPCSLIINVPIVRKYILCSMRRFTATMASWHLHCVRHH